MTKKDYILIGKELASRYNFIDEDTVVGFNEALEAICTAFRADNPAFKEDRFRDFVLGKCGPNGGRIK